MYDGRRPPEECAQALDPTQILRTFNNNDGIMMHRALTTRVTAAMELPASVKKVRGG